jgi:hypothetical protein
LPGHTPALSQRAPRRRGRGRGQERERLGEPRSRRRRVRGMAGGTPAGRLPHCSGAWAKGPNPTESGRRRSFLNT